VLVAGTRARIPLEDLEPFLEIAGVKRIGDSRRLDRTSGDRIRQAALLIRTLVGENASSLQRWLADDAAGVDWVRWLERQGLAQYAYWRLQGCIGFSGLSESVQAVLRNSYYQGVAFNALQRDELEQVLSVLAQSGVETVILKGMALAYTVYEDPLCRQHGDLDLWIRPEHLSEAMKALESLGYTSHDKADRPAELICLVGGEQQMRSDIPGLGMIELQWPALRGEWVRGATAVDSEAIWRRRVPVVIEGCCVHIMAPEDTLIHLVLHQAINHQFGHPWLRGLLDIHLVILRQAIDWDEFVARALGWRVAVVTWSMLDLVSRLLGAPVPETVLQSLAPSRWQQSGIARLRLEQALLEMRPGGYRHRRFLIQLLLVDRARDAARLLGRGLFPESEWLRARYGASTPGALWRARLAHPWRLLTSARA
jgi:hypothetical protein